MDICGDIFWDSSQTLYVKQLKFLYVAITRARQKLWIADYSDNSEPLRVSFAHMVYKECSVDQMMAASTDTVDETGTCREYNCH